MTRTIFTLSFVSLFLITSCKSNKNEPVSVQFTIRQDHKTVIDNSVTSTTSSSQFGGLSITTYTLKDQPESFKKDWKSDKESQVGKINNIAVFNKSINNSEICNDTLIFAYEDANNYKYVYQGEVRTNLLRINAKSDSTKLNSTLFFKDSIIFNKCNNSSFHRAEANYLLQTKLLPQLRDATEDKMDL